MSLTQPLELEVVVGASLKLALRIIVTKLPEEAQAGRIERLKGKSKTRGSGHKYTKKHLAYARYNIYVTNAKVEELSGAEVVAMYTMRWQIELMFKQWKSQAGVESVAGKQAGRVIGEIYAKLIGLVLYMYLRQGVSDGGWLQEQSLWRGWEIWKSWLNWERVSLRWLDRSALSQTKMRDSLEQLKGRLAKYAKLESYPKRLSSLMQLEQVGKYGQLGKKAGSKGHEYQTKSLA